MSISTSETEQKISQLLIEHNKSSSSTTFNGRVSYNLSIESDMVSRGDKKKISKLCLAKPVICYRYQSEFGTRETKNITNPNKISPTNPNKISPFTRV